MSFEAMISPKKKVFPSVPFALRERKVTWKKEQTVEATFSSHVTVDRSVMGTATGIL